MKKILFQSGLGANHHIRTTLAKGFVKCGYNVFYWNDQSKSTFDVFEEFEPDIVFSSVWQLNRSLVKNLAKNPHVKLVLWSDAYGDILNEIDLKKYPIGVTTEEQLRLTDQIRHAGVEPVLITNHGTKDISYTHGWWQSKLGLQVHSVLTSADISEFYPRQKEDKYYTDICYVGGYWTYKAINLDKYILPLLKNPPQWKVRLAGSGWSGPNSIGSISDGEAAKHYSNASIIPHVVEPHATVFSDIPLRYTQVAACGGFAISCPVKGIEEIFPNGELIVAVNEEDFLMKCEYFLSNPDSAENYRLRALQTVLAGHTNLHRCMDLLRYVGEPTTLAEEKIKQIGKK